MTTAHGSRYFQVFLRAWPWLQTPNFILWISKLRPGKDKSLLGAGTGTWVSSAKAFSCHSGILGPDQESQDGLQQNSAEPRWLDSLSQGSAREQGSARTARALGRGL